jgi:hypothetical protein
MATVSPSGRLAQLGERLPYKQEVACSIHAPPTFERPFGKRTRAWQLFSLVPVRAPCAASDVEESVASAVAALASLCAA